MQKNLIVHQENTRLTKRVRENVREEKIDRYVRCATLISVYASDRRENDSCLLPIAHMSFFLFLLFFTFQHY